MVVIPLEETKNNSPASDDWRQTVQVQEAKMNVFDFALKMEEDGKAFYEKLAAETDVPEFRTIFSLLAAAEEEHQRTIEALRKEMSPGNAESKVLEKAKSVFKGL